MSVSQLCSQWAGETVWGFFLSPNSYPELNQLPSHFTGSPLPAKDEGVPGPSCPVEKNTSPLSPKLGYRSSSLSPAEVLELGKCFSWRPGSGSWSPPCLRLSAPPGRKEETSLQHLLSLCGQGVSPSLPLPGLVISHIFYT